MANRFLGEITTEVDGQTYKLRLDFNAMAEFEDATGKEAFAVFAAFENGKASVKDMRAILWAGLREHHPDVDMKGAGAILSHDVDILRQLLEACMPGEGEAPASGNAVKARKKAA